MPAARPVAPPAPRRHADEPACRPPRRLALERHRDHRPDGGARAHRASPRARRSPPRPGPARPRPACGRSPRPRPTGGIACAPSSAASPRRSGRSSSRRSAASAGRCPPRSSRAPPTATTSRADELAASTRGRSRNEEVPDGIDPEPARRRRPVRSTRIPPSGFRRRAKLEILGAVMLGMFLAALDQTIVGPVLPKIITELNGADYYTWAVTIYLLTSTVTVPIYGKLSDLYGRKPILMFGIALFLARLGAVRPEPGDVAARPVPRASRASAPARSSRSRSRSSATCSPRPSEASTRASSVSSSASAFILGPLIGGLPHRHVQLALHLLRQPADRRSSPWP